MLLHEALADVERARTLDERMRILVDAIRRVGYGRVDTVDSYTMPDGRIRRRLDQPFSILEFE